MKLKTKLIIGSILLTGTGVLAISQFSYQFIVRLSEKDLQAKGTTLANHFAEQYSEYIQMKDEATLLKGLLDLCNDPVVLYGMVLDLEGRIIAHTDINQVGQSHKELAEKIANSKENILFQELSKDGVLDVTARAQLTPATKSMFGEQFFIDEAESGNQPIGIVRLGLSTHSMKQFIQRIRRGMVLIAVLILILTFMFSFLIAQYITRPIGKLLFGIRQISSGNLEHKVDVVSKDEVGQVGRAFNKMTQDLSQAKNQLVQTNSDLEKQVTDLAKAKHELEDAQDRLLKSERFAAIGQLAAGVGHELRNPLGAIKNALYYIRDVMQESKGIKEEAGVGEFLTLAEKEVDNSTKIVNDLLDFARTVTLDPCPTNINVLIKNLLETIEVSPKIKINHRLDPDIPTMMIDPERMAQIFRNILMNAVQAMPRGGELTISTRLAGADSSEERVEILFQDAGVGISPQNMEKIFEPLFTTKAKGAGLGLAICRQLVEKHGGEILVESQLGKGSLFTVKIPHPKKNENVD